MAEIPELTNGEFESFIKEGIVLIDFFAEWCMPCMMMLPILEDVAEEFKDKLKIGKVNVEDNADIAQKQEVGSIPNFIVFKDGKKIDQFMGSMTQDELTEKIKEHL
ncbi:MAG: thioredoxin [Nanoarchaeota archaeon]|nr:thioredoxin [Nanoarchaeota archaeon]